MSASLKIFDSLGERAAPSRLRQENSGVQAYSGGWNTESFAAEQIQNLVRQVFSPGFPRPARQVVFSAALPEQKIGRLCARIGETLASNSLDVCLVEADLRTRSLQINFGGTSTDGRETPDLAGAVRKSSLQLSSHLWLVPAEVFVGEKANLHSVLWLRSRLGVLRREFDYTVIHAPAFGAGTEPCLLGHLADGIILVLEANRTRRATANSIRESLNSFNVRLLGAVLSERTFPIPEGLYRRL
jgi:hypothetical protein